MILLTLHIVGNAFHLSNSWPCYRKGTVNCTSAPSILYAIYSNTKRVYRPAGINVAAWTGIFSSYFIVSSANRNCFGIFLKISI